MEERAAAGELPSLHPVSQRVLEALSDIAEGRPGVLELGCGSGDLTVSLLERGAARVSGVDLSLALGWQRSEGAAHVAGAERHGTHAAFAFRLVR